MSILSFLTPAPDWFPAFLEKWWPQVLEKGQEHLYLVGISMAIAIAVAVPLGVLLSKIRFRPLSWTIMAIASVIQTIPSLALIALSMTAIGWINLKFGTKLDQIGTAPALIALVAYALLPILRNTYTGLRQVDPALVDVARGMGMTSIQILRRVEIPLAIPFMMAGIRISTVWTIGIATLVTFIGAGGLGDLINVGLARQQDDRIYAGVVAAIFLALSFDLFLWIVEKILTPKGAKTEKQKV